MADKSLIGSASAVPAYMQFRPSKALDFRSAGQFMDSVQGTHQWFMAEQEKARPNIEGYEQMMDQLDAMPGDHSVLTKELSSAISSIENEAKQFHGYWRDYEQTLSYKEKMDLLRKILVNMGSAGHRKQDFNKGYSLHEAAGTLGEKAIVHGNYVYDQNGNPFNVNEYYRALYSNESVYNANGQLMQTTYDSKGYLGALPLDSNTSTMQTMYEEVGKIFNSAGYTGHGDSASKLSALGTQAGVALPVILNTAASSKSNIEQLRAATTMLLNGGLSVNSVTGLMRGYSGEGDLSLFIAKKIKEYAKVFATSDYQKQQKASQVRGSGGSDLNNKTDYVWAVLQGNPAVVDLKTKPGNYFTYDENNNIVQATDKDRPSTRTFQVPPTIQQELFPIGSDATSFGVVTFGNRVDFPISMIPGTMIAGSVRDGEMQKVIGYPEHGGFAPPRRGQQPEAERPSNVVPLAIPVSKLKAIQETDAIPLTGHQPFHVPLLAENEQEWVPLINDFLFGFGNSIREEITNIEDVGEIEVLSGAQLAERFKSKSGGEWKGEDFSEDYIIVPVRFTWPNSLPYSYDATGARLDYGRRTEVGYLNAIKHFQESLSDDGVINLQDTFHD